MDYYILKDKTPVRVDDAVEWARYFEEGDNQVALTRLPSSTRISTVFLGLDHSHVPGLPILFETMVSGGPLDSEMARYSTYTEAEAGHENMVLRCKQEEFETP